MTTENKDGKGPSSLAKALEGETLDQKAAKLEALRLSASRASIESKKAAQLVYDKRVQKRQGMKNLNGTKTKAASDLTNKVWAVWEQTFKATYPGITCVSSGKLRGQIDQLLKMFKDDVQKVCDGAEFMIKRWGLLRPKLGKLGGATPTIGVLLIAQDQIFPAMELASNWFKTLEEWEVFSKYNATQYGIAEPPEGLSERHTVAIKGLKEMGFLK